MLYAIFHVFVCSMSCAIVALLSLCLSFLCFGLSVRTWSRPYGLCHCPYTLAHIKGFGSSLLACLCLLASYALFSMLASLIIGFAMLDPLSRFVVVWLHTTLMRPCLDVTIWDASPWCWLLHAYLSPFSLRAMICLPCLFMPPVGFLCIFTILFTWSCMSLACQCVVHASTQWNYGHLIQTYICPSRTPPFVCFLACFSSHLFAHFLVSLLAMSTTLNCFMPLSYALCIFSFHCMSAGFLSLPLHVHTWSEDAWS